MTSGSPAIDLSVEAALFVREHGGKLFIWTQRQVCRGRICWRTQVSPDEPGHLKFHRVFDSEQVQVYLACGSHASGSDCEVDGLSDASGGGVLAWLYAPVTPGPPSSQA